jgi:DNA-binding NarL/FixJ family response regulator
MLGNAAGADDGHETSETGPASEGDQFKVFASPSRMLGPLVAGAITSVAPESSARLVPVDGESANVTVEAASTGRRLVIFREEPAATEVADAIESGTWAILSIDAGPDDFLAAVRSLSHGGARYVATSVVSALARARVEGATLPEPDRLTEREREVLLLLAEGCSNREIGTRLFVSENTVRSHVRSILAKLDVASRSKCVVRARELGMLA